MSLTILTIIINLSLAFGFAGFVFRNMVYLRTFATLSALLEVIFCYYSVPLNWNGMAWKSLFVLINVIQIAIIFYETTHLNFSSEEKNIFKNYFSNFSVLQFKRLIRSGVFINAPTGELLTEQGKKVLRIILVYKGAATVEINGEIVAYCKAGNIIGEMSFLSKGVATATVRTIEPTRYVMWLVDDLQKLLRDDPDINNAMQTVFNKDLVNKLAAMKPTHAESKIA